MAFSSMDPDQMPKWHYTSSDSPQFSDEGYSTGSHEPEPEIETKLYACAPVCHATGNGLNGFAKNGNSAHATGNGLNGFAKNGNSAHATGNGLNGFAKNGNSVHATGNGLNGFAKNGNSVHATGNGLNGFAKNGNSAYVVNGHRSPTVTEQMDFDTYKTSQQQMYYSIPTESKRATGCQGRKCDQSAAKSRPSRPPLLPPCRVCGDRASGFHYGVNTCEACKGFFRRSINKTSDPYACVGNGRCKLVPGKRTACSACRYQRCLEVGMSKSAIKTGRYTHELRSKNIMEVKKLQMKQGPDENSPLSDTDAIMDTLDDPIPDRNASSPCVVEDRELEDLLKALMEGQTNLHEFLDDYYDDELMRSKQVAVYDRYMKTKRESLAARARTQMPEAGCKKEHAVNITLVNDKHLDRAVKRDDNNAIPGDTGEVTHKQDIATRGGVEKTCTGAILGEVTRNGDIANAREINGVSVRREDILKTNGHGAVPSLKQRLLNCKENNQNLSNNTPEHTSKTTDPGCESCGTRNSNAGDIKEPSKGDHSDERQKAEVLTQVMLDMERGVQGMLAFCRCLPGFDVLSGTDQATLVKAARFDIWYIGHIRCFNVDLRVGACEWQFHAEELEKVWGKPIVELAFRLSRRGHELDLSKEETAALRALVLTFPDRCYPLTSRAAVESLHARMLQLLRYVGARRNRKFSSWFPKVIDFLTILREFGISFEQVSSCLKLDWSVLHDNPYLLEVFLS